MIVKRAAIATAVILSIGFSVRSYKTQNHHTSIDEESDSESEDFRPKKNHSRKPASVKASAKKNTVTQRTGPRFKISDQSIANGNHSDRSYDDGPVADVSSAPSPVSSEISYSDYSSPNYNQRPSRSSSSTNDSGKSAKTVKASNRSSQTLNGFFGGGGPIASATNTTNVQDDLEVDEPATSTTNLSDMNCSSDVGSGSFSTPINVALTCSDSATIKYCLSEGSCSTPCDPASGSNYGGTIPVGESTKTYCLSFLGSSSRKTSTVQNVSYTFTKTPLDLEVQHLKTVYQTTQLSSSMNLASLDLPGDSAGFGVVNLLGSDPGSQTCSEIVDDLSNLSPAPRSILPLTDVSGLSAGQIMQVFFGVPDLQYGDNWITSYHKSSIFDNVYSCETNKIILQDFEAFELGASNVIINGSGHAELSGGFTPVGTFEEDTSNLYRIPAGSSLENQNDQELRTGIFGMFYL
jgi:hypothetical protein